MRNKQRKWSHGLRIEENQCLNHLLYIIDNQADTSCLPTYSASLKAKTTFIFIMQIHTMHLHKAHYRVRPRPYFIIERNLRIVSLIRRCESKICILYVWSFLEKCVTVVLQYRSSQQRRCATSFHQVRIREMLLQQQASRGGSDH